MSGSILTLVIFSPLLGMIAVILNSEDRPEQVRKTALTFSLLTLILTLFAVGLFFDDPGAAKGQYVLEYDCAWFGAGTGNNIDIRYHVGIDGISVWLLLLTSFLTPLAIWASFTDIRERVKEYYALMLILQTGMLGVFCALDLLLFYVFFEFTLIPLFFMIGIWGGPAKRQASYKFFIYTLAGSVLTFAGVLFLAYYAWANELTSKFTMDIQTLTTVATSLPATVQFWLFLAFAAGFSIKVPLFPFHTWLPLAHTEAPTAGSVILAGVLLKLGTYGYFRISLPVLPEATYSLAPFMAGLAIIGVIYGSLAAWVQKDVKKLVAYSSVAHLGFCMLGMFSLKMAGLIGSVMYMINHGLSTGALFLTVGMMYERYHTRDIDKIGGLAKKMPWLTFFLIFFTLSSIGLPGLNGFIGEFLVLMGTALSKGTYDGLAAGSLGYAFVIPAALGIIFSAVYMLWMCQRILFGPLKEPPNTPDFSRGLRQDLGGREIAILAPIALVCLIIGVWPKPMLTSIESAIRTNIVAARAIDQDTVTASTLPMDTIATGTTSAVAAADTKQGEPIRPELFTDEVENDG